MNRAKAVNVWTWRRALRDHGPSNPSVLLTLYTIATALYWLWFRPGERRNLATRGLVS